MAFSIIGFAILYIEGFTACNSNSYPIMFGFILISTMTLYLKLMFRVFSGPEWIMNMVDTSSPIIMCAMLLNLIYLPIHLYFVPSCAEAPLKRLFIIAYIVFQYIGFGNVLTIVS